MKHVVVSSVIRKFVAWKLRPLLMAAFIVPVNSLDEWKTEKFSKGPGNDVTASATGLKIKVRSSASPLILPLKEKQLVSSFRVQVHFSDLPRFSDVAKQGLRGADDFPFRLGFIVPGDKKLTGVKKMFASSWVKHLFSQIPQETGLDRIEFFNVVQNKTLVGTSREHPASDLLRENFIYWIEKPGAVSIEHRLKSPIEAVALWISIDGDDTKSSYEVEISKIGLASE